MFQTPDVQTSMQGRDGDRSDQRRNVPVLQLKTERNELKMFFRDGSQEVAEPFQGLTYCLKPKGSPL